MKLARKPIQVALGVTFLVACGSSVSVIGGGPGGASGAGGAATSSSHAASGGAGPGPGPAPASNTAVGPTASVVSSNAVSSSSFASSSTGAMSCDNQGDCQACAECAASGPCSKYVAACDANQECVAIVQCYQQCFKKDCTVDCWVPHPNGHKSYLQMAICIYCDNCFVDCGNGEQGCPMK